MRVAVIGGTVFIGRAITEELAKQGHELVIVHRGQHEPEGLPQARHLHADRRELDGVAAELRQIAPDAIVHTVAITRQDAEAALGALGTDVHWVVLSSADVYRAYGALTSGRADEPVPLDESSPVREERYPFRGKVPGMDDYEKLDVEEAFLAAEGTILRLPFVYGERDYQRREEFILRRVRAGRGRIPFGDGGWLGSRAYVRDVATAVAACLGSGEVRGEVLNVSERRTYALRTWARMILDAAGSEAELVTVPSDLLPEDLSLAGAGDQHMLLDSGKARRLLGWTDTPPEEALAATVSWHLQHPPEAEQDFAADDRALAAPDRA